MKIKFKCQEIEIPEGATFKVVGGDLVISSAKDEFKVGDICIFWDNDKTLAVIGRLSYINNSDDPYGSNYGYCYKNAIKCTLIEQYKNFISNI